MTCHYSTFILHEICSTTYKELLKCTAPLPFAFHLAPHIKYHALQDVLKALVDAGALLQYTPREAAAHVYDLSPILEKMPEGRGARMTLEIALTYSLASNPTYTKGLTFILTRRPQDSAETTAYPIAN